MHTRLLHVLLAVPIGLLLAGCSGKSTRDVEKLLADLTSESEAARSRAERSLTEHGRAVVKPLSSIITGEDFEDVAKEFGITAKPETLRVKAARALGVIADKASLARSEAETAAQPLLDALTSDDAELRIEAARALGYFTQLSAPANDLILLLRSDDEKLVAAATDSLARNALRSAYRLVLPDEPAATAAEKNWPRLLERIRSTDDDIRLDTVRELAASRDPRAAPLLLERLADDKSRDVRYAALCYCEGAANAGEPQGFADKLNAQLPATFTNEDDSRVALLAAQLLAKLGKTNVAPFLERVDAATRKCEETLLAQAANADFDAGTRADAINALSLLPSDARDDLLARMLEPATGEARRIRRAAAGVLAGTQSPKATAALEQAMNDGDAIVKLVAAQALGRRPSLDPAKRLAAVKYLIDLLSDPEAKIRTPAADALGTLGVAALPVLVEQLNTALAGAATLAQWQVPLAELMEKAERTSEDDANIAKHTEAIEDYRDAHPGRSDKYIAWGIVSGIGQIAAQAGPGAAAGLDPLIAAARCHYPEVRRVAAHALGNFTGHKPLATLGTALCDPDETVRWYAVAALEQHGAAAVPTLVAALDEPKAAAAAAAALGRIGDAQTLKPLLDHMPAATGETRESLVWAVGETLARHPQSAHAAAARQALTAASKLHDAPSTARIARYALRKAAPTPELPK